MYMYVFVCRWAVQVGLVPLSLSLSLFFCSFFVFDDVDFSFGDEVTFHFFPFPFSDHFCFSSAFPLQLLFSLSLPLTPSLTFLLSTSLSLPSLSPSFPPLKHHTLTLQKNVSITHYHSTTNPHAF